MTTQHTAAVERLNAHIEAGTVIRDGWTGTDALGRHTACLLSAMWPLCGSAESPDWCPADIMRPWLAHMTPWINTAGSLASWPYVIRRYAAAAARWHVLSDAQLGRLHQLARAACVREAMRHTQNPPVLAVCEDIASTLEQGDWPTMEQRENAADAAVKAMLAQASSLAPSETAALSAAADAASKPSWAQSLAQAASAAAEAASEESWDAEVAVSVAMAAAEEAAQVSSDRLIDAILTLIEQACSEAEAA